jgi:2-polyprenyl-6-methoxyphenol hydroxylase-like FAD-dependent oxidoreductase
MKRSCLIAGGGPAGMMLGYLLARAGIDVTVLEKHADFLRDFRGDTIHPSTLTVMDELGLLEEFLKRPHQEVKYAQGEIGGRRLRLADFTHLPGKCKFIVFMPQWDFLDFLSEKARAFPNFHLMMRSEAKGLIREGGRVSGLKVQTPEGVRDILVDLVVGADGRASVLRDAAGLKVRDLGAPMDVLWFRLPYRQEDTNVALGRIVAGGMFIMLYRGDYWQCASIIRKGSFEAVKAAGLAAFRVRVAELAHRSSADEIQSWDDVRLLTVRVDRLERWHLPGILFIGDAAHAMSPVGGVGINLAIQDAVAAANLLAAPLLHGTLQESDLAAVQRRRRFPTWATQKMQVTAQNAVIDPLLASGRLPKVPGILTLAQRWTFLQRIPARIIGMGFRPEHVKAKMARG